MTKIQIGWKAKDGNGEWTFYTLKPFIHESRPDEWVCLDSETPHTLYSHPEQPEIPWEDSLQPVFIEV